MFHPLWSEEILDEVERNLPKLGIDPRKAARRVDLMRASFGSEALISGSSHLIDQMGCHAKDRHVLTAAVHIMAVKIVKGSHAQTRVDLSPSFSTKD